MTNQDQNNSKFDDVMGGVIIVLYIVGLFMFARYIVKSVNDMAERNRAKQQNTPIINKKTTNTINYIDALRQR